jgi:hypothetical protein
MHLGVARRPEMHTFAATFLQPSGIRALRTGRTRRAWDAPRRGTPRRGRSTGCRVGRCWCSGPQSKRTRCRSRCRTGTGRRGCRTHRSSHIGLARWCGSDRLARPGIRPSCRGSGRPGRRWAPRDPDAEDPLDHRKSCRRSRRRRFRGRSWWSRRRLRRSSRSALRRSACRCHRRSFQARPKSGPWGGPMSPHFASWTPPGRLPLNRTHRRRPRRRCTRETSMRKWRQLRSISGSCETWTIAPMAGCRSHHHRGGMLP